jgi:hypothetical protein
MQHFELKNTQDGRHESVCHVTGFDILEKSRFPPNFERLTLDYVSLNYDGLLDNVAHVIAAGGLKI